MPEEKKCIQCDKTFIAKRKDAKFCSGSCRAFYSQNKKLGGIIEKATPKIIADAAPSIIDAAFEKKKINPNSIEGLSIRLRAFEIALKYEKEFKRRKIIEHKMNILADQLIKLELATD